MCLSVRHGRNTQTADDLVRHPRQYLAIEPATLRLLLSHPKRRHTHCLVISGKGPRINFCSFYQTAKSAPSSKLEGHLSLLTLYIERVVLHICYMWVLFQSSKSSCTVDSSYHAKHIMSNDRLVSRFDRQFRHLWWRRGLVVVSLV